MSTRKGSIVDEVTPLLDPTFIESVTYTSPNPIGSESEEQSNEPIPENESRAAQNGDEESLINPDKPTGQVSKARVLQVVSVLLIGMFISNADGSLVMATHPIIASEFNKLKDSSWLFISFSLAAAATQNLHAKLSDVFGRRAILVSSYALFAIGCAIVGLGRSMGQVILGRVISGSGGAGLTVVAAIIVTDLVPLREVASWNSYINLVSTLGRSLGGPIGGFLADTIGWRWSFLGQSPIFLIALVLSLVLMPNSQSAKDGGPEQLTTKQRLARIDFLGALFLGLAILAFMIPLEFGGQKIAWTHPAIFILFGLGVLFLGLFAVVETRFAIEPIFPLRLLKNKDVVASYIITFSQTAAQLSMMFAVPLYFQVSQKASATAAGAHLIPAVVGNALGAVLSGIYIKRTGTYKALVIGGVATAASGYILLYFRWHGNTNFWESLYIFPTGLGTGIAMTVVFIALQASISPSDKAAATAGFFLTFPIGMMTGLAITTAVMLGTLQSHLEARLIALGISGEDRDRIIREAVGSIESVYKAKGVIGEAIVKSYLDGISNGLLLSFSFAILAVFTALFIRQRKL